MLKSLLIQNYVLIDNLDISFGGGLSVITGETGAGKSIVLGALSLVLGQRADVKSIQAGADKCVIEAAFDIEAYRLQPFFDENELEYDAENCILRRELHASGKSRAFINDSPVSLGLMKDLGSRLIDIHSQHQNLLLGSGHFQLMVVDVMAKNDSLLSACHKAYSNYQALKKEHEELLEKAARLKQEEDYTRFQLEQLTEAELEAGEQESLEQEQEMLSHAEEIKRSLYHITALLNGEENSSLPYLKEALSKASGIEHYYPKAKEIAQRIREAYIDLNDLAMDTEVQQEGFEFDPQRLEHVNQRLDLIYSLLQKHRMSTVDELLSLRDEYAARLKEIDSFEEQIATVSREEQCARALLLEQAGKLTKQRTAVSKEITMQLEQMIASLGIPNARFSIEITPKDMPGKDGADNICFLFSANKSAALSPVAETASGGEISRLMLCVKAMIAGSTAMPAIIFDEIDTGVSGDIADKMGDIMRRLSANMQVVTITHLPQIAAKGKKHYFVYKEEMPEKSVTRIKQLDEKERVIEIARMLSGATLTDAAIANAHELLKSKN